LILGCLKACLGLQQNLWVLSVKKQAAKEEMAAPGLIDAGLHVLADRP